MIEVENTDVNIVRNLIPMRNHMPASAYGLKAISDCFFLKPANHFPSTQKVISTFNRSRTHYVFFIFLERVWLRDAIEVQNASKNLLIKKINFFIKWLSFTPLFPWLIFGLKFLRNTTVTWNHKLIYVSYVFLHLDMY